jgi:hypothetical protein
MMSCCLCKPASRLYEEGESKVCGQASRVRRLRQERIDEPYRSFKKDNAADDNWHIDLNYVHSILTLQVLYTVRLFYFPLSTRKIKTAIQNCGKSVLILHRIRYSKLCDSVSIL